MFEKCPQCGFQEAIVVSKFSSVMNVYVTKEGKRATYNTDQEKFSTTNGVEWVREDIANAKVEADKLASKDAQAKVLSPTPTPTPIVPGKK